MGHVVCIKGISSHFKRWPGFSPPGTPVTHPLVHTPFKEPGTAAPLQPLSTVCVCACIHFGNTAKQSDIVSLLSCHSEFCTVTYSQPCGGSNHQQPHLQLKNSKLFFCTVYICSSFNTSRHWINKTLRMIFHQVCQCLVIDLYPWTQPLIGRPDFWGMWWYLSVVLCVCVRPRLNYA